MSEPTVYEVAAGVATITLDSPANRNAFSQSLVLALDQGIADAVADDAVRVIVLTNTGTVFSAGADLKEDRASLGPDALTFTDVVHRIDASPKPVIAKVAGHAAGGGAGLVVCCDMAVAATSAKIGITEVRIGIPAMGVAALLAHRMSHRALIEAFLTGDMMPAARAAELGMINMAVPDDELDATVDRLCESLARSGPRSVAKSKRILQQMADLTPEQAMALGNAASTGAFETAEAKEGVAAFVEKRDPDWVP